MINEKYNKLFDNMTGRYYINKKNSQAYKVIHVAIECTNGRERDDGFVVVYCKASERSMLLGNNTIFVRDLDEFLEKFESDTKLNTALFYNPEYGDDKLCRCGHTYYRHFDSYENMNHVGCKYCDCYLFDSVEDNKNERNYTR